MKIWVLLDIGKQGKNAFLYGGQCMVPYISIQWSALLHWDTVETAPPKLVEIGGQ